MSNRFYKGCPQGQEVRGFVVRLYPDAETEEVLCQLENDMRRAWNWLVKQTEDVIDARMAYAVREGLVPERPIRPDYNGLTPEKSRAKKAEFIKACQEWHGLVHEAVKKVEGCSFHKFKDLLEHYQCKHDYQLLSKVIGWYHENDEEKLAKPQAHLLQALTKNYFAKSSSQRRKKFRKSSDAMPIQTRSGECFKLGDFGTRRGNPFYDCQVSINGLKIRGRLPGKMPEGRILEGVSVRKEADGWYASIKQEVPIRVLPNAVPNTVIGIDMGLDNIAAMSDGTLIENTRGKDFVKLIAERQAKDLPVGRLHQANNRRVKHIIYNEIIKPLSAVETIKVEHLSSRIGQMGSSKVSVMRLVFKLLCERYGARDIKGQPMPGNRLREVECAYTSQDCSQCGFRSKDTWSYEHGKVGKCPECGHEEHRDINAARNVAAKPAISLVS